MKCKMCTRSSAEVVAICIPCVELVGERLEVAERARQRRSEGAKITNKKLTREKRQEAAKKAWETKRAK